MIENIENKEELKNLPGEEETDETKDMAQDYKTKDSGDGSEADKEEMPDKEELLKEIEKYKADAEEMKNLAKRTMADFANYKKRTEKEMEQISLFANEKILLNLLEVLDNFDRALASIDDKENEFYKGVDLIKTQLFDTMKKAGVTEIEALGEDFDPHRHHAVVSEETDDPDKKGKVTEVFQKGYMLSDRVLRASMVKVAS